MINKELIKEMIVSFQQSLPKKNYPRERIVKADTGKISVYVGVRRCGKTSSMYLTINNLINNGIDRSRILFLNFDDERLSFEPSDFDTILQAFGELYPKVEMGTVYMFFDEIQVTNGWEQFIRRIYEQVNQNIYLTGSNSKLLSTEIASSLRGRTLQTEFFPLSFAEYLTFSNVNYQLYSAADKVLLRHHFERYLKAGGFPELVKYRENLTKEDAEKILQEYYFVMIYRDLVERYEIKNIPALKYFLRRVLVNSTKPTSIRKIYHELKSAGIEVSKNLLYQWIEYVEQIYLFLSLSKFEPSLVKEHSGDKKYYCIDTGLYQALNAQTSENRGVLLENAVFMHLRRQTGFQRKLHYFKGKHECDFVVTSNEAVEKLIQVSWDISDDETYKREMEGLIEASNRLNCIDLTLVTMDQTNTVTYKGFVVYIVPAYRYFIS
jgi:predicted AAA+ superfamily ATPase